MLNVKNFAELKKLITTLGVANAKSFVPLLVGFAMNSGRVKAKDSALLEKQLTALITLAIEMVDNVESVS